MDEDQEIARIIGMTLEEITEWVKAGGRDPRKVLEEVDETFRRAKRDALIRLKERGN